MTTKGLAKEYARLTAAERFRVMIAAAARDDDVECQRLLDSAPPVRYDVPHHFGRVNAFREVLTWQQMVMLDNADMYLWTFAMSDSDDEDLAKWMGDCAMSAGYLFEVQRDGWRLFCLGERIDPDAATRGLPGDDLFSMVARVTSDSTYTAEEALAFLRRKSDADSIPTAEIVAAGLCRMFAERTAWWG